jgi:hypothetical protein
VEENRIVYRGLVETSEEKRPLGRPVSRWEDKGILRQHAEMVCIQLTISDLGEGKVAGCCELADKPMGLVKCGEFLE